MRLPYFIRKIWYKIRLFSKLLKHYQAAWDITDTLFHFNFITFCEFYEEGGLDTVDWVWNEVDREAKAEMDYLYNWYTKDRLDREEEIEVVSDTHAEHCFMIWNAPWFHTPKNKYGDYLFKMLLDLEDKYYQEITDNLVRLMKIRMFLST